MKRRTKGTFPAIPENSRAGLRLRDARLLVAPIEQRSATVTLRLTGPWFELWERLRAAVPNVSDAELLREGLALRIALAGQDAQGQKPRAIIEYHDEAGTLITADLEEYVGIAEKNAD